MLRLIKFLLFTASFLLASSVLASADQATTNVLQQLENGFSTTTPVPDMSDSAQNKPTQTNYASSVPQMQNQMQNTTPTNYAAAAPRSINAGTAKQLQIGSSPSPQLATQNVSNPKQDYPALAADGSLNAMVGYVNPDSFPPNNSNLISPIRLKALRDTAITLGATGALAWRSLQIQQSTQDQAKSLDHIFNFNQLLLNNNVLPPILVEADNSLRLSGGNAIRLASKVYKIHAPARFVTTPPTWRDYLLMSYRRPDLPHHSLLPTNQQEAQSWNYYLKQGWKQGLTQANTIFRTNLDRLKRDFAGMILYRKLLSEHMVSAPYVAKANLGVTGDSHELRINDQVLRITAESGLQTNSQKWRPVLANPLN